MFLGCSAIQHKGVALSLPIIYSWSVPATILSMIFYGQHPSAIQWFGLAATVIGLFLVSIDRKNKNLIDIGTFIAFISMFIWALFYFLIKEPSQHYGEWWIGGALKVGTAIFGLPFLLTEQSPFSKPGKNLWIVGIIGFLDAIGLVAISKGLQISSTAIVSGITSTAPVVVAFFGVLLFKETVNKQQVFGILSTAAGLVLLVV